MADCWHNRHFVVQMHSSAKLEGWKAKVLCRTGLLSACPHREPCYPLLTHSFNMYMAQGWIGRCMSDDRPVGPQRMYLPQQDIPGLALTRSIGDFVATGIGLSSQPDVIEYQVRSQLGRWHVCHDCMCFCLCRYCGCRWCHKLRIVVMVRGCLTASIVAGLHDWQTR